MNYHPTFTQLKVFEKLFTQGEVMKETCKLIKTFAKKNLFLHVLVDFLETKGLMKNLFSILFYVSHHIGFKNLLTHIILIPQVYPPVKKIIKLSTNDRIYLKCDLIDGKFVNGLRQTILYSFVLD